MTSERARLYLHPWPIGGYIFENMHLTIERIVGHLVGGWVAAGGGYTDPEVNPWVALVCEPVVPKRLAWPREPRFREHDKERLVAGELPKRYAIHCVSGGGSYGIVNVKDIKVTQHNNLTVYECWPRPTIVRFTDQGSNEPGDYDPGGEVVIAGMWAIGVDGEPNFPLRLPKWTKRSHLPVLCAWLDTYAEEQPDGPQSTA
jgi:hypothetical protein